MSTTIVFVVIKDGNVVNVAEDESLANLTASRYPGAVVDAWVLDARSVEDATMDEWLLGRKVHPFDNLNDGDVVYFSDEIVRGIGKVSFPEGFVKLDAESVIKIQVSGGDMYDKLSKRVISLDTPVFMYLNDIKGIVK